GRTDCGVVTTGAVMTLTRVTWVPRYVSSLGRARSAIAPRDSRLCELVGVDHAAAGELAHHLVLAVARHRDASLRPAEHAVERDHVSLGVPGIVDDDGARLGIIVRPVEPADLHRKPVFAVVIIAGDIGPVRRRVGPEIVREALEVTRVRRVGTAAMADAVAL